MSKVKYLGSADRRVIPKGSNFGGRLAEPIDKKVEFSHENHFLIDTEEAGLSEEAVKLLLESDDFKDVTDNKTYPRSGAEARRYGRGRVDAEATEEEGEPARAGATSGPGGSGGGRTGGTTAGGSTRGGAGGGGTTAGGSTAGSES